MTRSPDSAAVRVFPPAIPLVLIFLGVGLERWFPLEIGTEPAAATWIGRALIVFAIAIFGAWPVLLQRKSGQKENPWQPTTEIIDRGPYRISRNPMYLQMVLICLGGALLYWNLWLLILTPVCALLLWWLAIAPEEAYLEGKFGDDYTAYKKRVRRWL